MAQPTMTATHGLALMQAINSALAEAIAGDSAALQRAQLLVQVLENVMSQAVGG